MKKLLIISIVLAINFASQAQNTFPSNGNVGIGTTSANATLHISDIGNSTVTSLQLNNRIKFRGDGVINWGASADYGTLSWNVNKTLIGGMVDKDLSLLSNGVESMILKVDGNIGIGTTNPDMKLTVKGKIHAEEVKIDLSIPAPDYVFREDYNLRSLNEVEKFIKENNHLPEISSAKEFKNNGLMLAEMDMNLLKKVEELTLYTIAQEKKIEKVEKENESLKSLAKKFVELQKRLEKLEKE